MRKLMDLSFLFYLIAFHCSLNFFIEFDLPISLI